MELSAEKLLSPDLFQLVTIVMAGKEDLESSETLKRLIFSILARDVPCSVRENMEIAKPYSSLCGHLFRSKMLNMILHWLGHSESYEFSLELVTTLAKSLNEVPTCLTPQIMKGGTSYFTESETTGIKPLLMYTAVTFSIDLEESCYRS